MVVSRVNKIHKNYEFRIVYSKGRSFSNELMIIYVYKNRKNLNDNRLGISVSKKVGKSVTRNRVRRLVYEVYRKNLGNLKKGYDLVFIARNRANNKNYIEIEKSVNHLFKKSNILNDK